ncbi:MAG: hypothetical protein IJ460_07550 [Clostridia bacterium]|nr:hypothetical protein [Clostridia bacterium]
MDIRIELITNEIVEIVKNYIENTAIDFDALIESRSVAILKRICDVIRNEKLSDFEMVEEIVCILEEHNISCGSCHDF